ncbi:hypothetical protein CN918_25680 [Priestia megaterium]|nr:hypothetical protein CN918_25680 [Priestia megaterium]
MIYRWIKLLAPILLIITFLFPWYSGFFASVSALKLAINPSSLSTIYEKLDITEVSILTESTWLFGVLCRVALVLPVLSLLSIALTISDKRTAIIHSLNGLVAMGLFVAHFALMKFHPDFLIFASYGLYSSGLLGLLLFIAAVGDKEEHLLEPKNEEYNDSW